MMKRLDPQWMIRLCLVWVLALAAGCGGGGSGGGDGSSDSSLSACRDNCQTAQRACGNNLFFAEYESVDGCTNECVGIVEDFASDANNFDQCTDAQVRFIDCCTRQGQCGEIPDGCDAEFDGAVTACGGSFGGCPLIFF